MDRAAVSDNLYDMKLRAEKAERERDALYAAMGEGRIMFFERDPMTTKDEEGRVYRVEVANDGVDCLYLTREGFATVIPSHSGDRLLYVLTPVKVEP